MDATAGSHDVRHYLRLLQRRKWTIALSVIVVLGAAGVSAELQTPRYQANAEVLLQSSSADTLFNANTGQANNPVQDVQTQIEVIQGRGVKQAVIKSLGSAPHVVASPVGQTHVINIAATRTDAASAAAIANSYATAYVEFRRTQDVNGLLAAAAQIQGRISDLQTQIDTLNAQAPPASKQSSSVSPQTPELDTLIQEQGAFKQQLAQLEVQAGIGTGGAQVVSPASVPTSPVTPRPLRDLLLGLAVGVLLGVAVAAAIDYLDDSLKSKEDLERIAGGTTPTLGVIPRVSTWKARDEPHVVSIEDPNSPPAEAYRSLRTSIQFASLERPLRMLQVTSPSAGEGKTTTLANLGVALAQAGQQVILACCDLRRPRLHEFFRMDNSTGFTSVVLGRLPVSAALQAVDDVDGLYVLASGPLPPNPSELLASRRTTEVMASLRGLADIVLVDCPPVLPVTDTAVLCGQVDGTLLVATVGSTTGKEVARAVELLGQVDAPLLGTVLNGVTGDGSYGYAYYRYHQTGTRSGDAFAWRDVDAPQRPAEVR